MCLKSIKNHLNIHLHKSLHLVGSMVLNNVFVLTEDHFRERKEVDELQEELGILASKNHNLLSALGVSHEKLEEAIYILSKYGLKGKLTGAGGGGYAIALVPLRFENSVIEDAKLELTNKGFEVMVTLLGGCGVLNGSDEMTIPYATTR